MKLLPRHLLPAATAALLLLGLAGCGKPPAVAAAPPAAPATTTVAANVPDRDVTEHVTTALRQAEALKGQDIAVVTLKGDVRLTGMVDTQAQIDEALRIARAADGAHTIHDELTLRK